MGWTPIATSSDGLRFAHYKEHDGWYEVWLSRVSDGKLLVPSPRHCATEADAIQAGEALVALSPADVLDKL